MTFFVSPGKKPHRPRRRAILLPEGLPQHARLIRSETRATLVAAIVRGRRWLDELAMDASITTDSDAGTKLSACSKIFEGSAYARRAVSLHGAGRRARNNRVRRIRLLWLLGYEFEFIGHSAKLWERTGVHLPHRPAAVDLHRGFGDTQIMGDLFAEPALRDLNHNFALPRA
jgi:hypothetical protein